MRTMVHVKNCIPFPWIAWCRKELNSSSSRHSDKPQKTSFPCLSFVFVVNIHNHKSGESDCREHLHVVISNYKYLDLYLVLWFIISCSGTFSTLQSKFISSLSNTFCIWRAEQTLGLIRQLFLECLQLFQSHFHILRHNKVIRTSLRILWILQDF